MLPVAIIAFREFLEAFLLVGLFVGIDRKFGLKKEKEITAATLIGITLSLFLPIFMFFFANDIHGVLTERNADTLEGYLLTFSGFFIAYVVFSLHSFLKDFSKKVIQHTHNKMEQEIFDISLFFTIIFFIAREGFEVAMLIATTSIFSTFRTNAIGLLIGFITACLIGLGTTFTYIKIPIGKVFTYTEYFIILVGAAMVKNGLTLLIARYTSIRLDKLFSLPLNFLPNDSTIIGHTLKNLFGLEPSLSMIQIGIMGAYVLVMYYLFLNKKVGVKAKK